MSMTKAGDINLEYHLQGSGPPLLMIMGFAGSASIWGEPLLEALRPHFTCIRFSNRGTGLSDKPDGQFTVRTMAGDAANLLTALDIKRPHVFGISLGGMIAQELVLNFPQHVNGLVLGCTGPGFAKGVQATPDTRSKLMPAPGLSQDEIVRNFWTIVCSAAFIERGHGFLEGMLASSLATPTPLETLGRQWVAIQTFDSYDRLPQIRAKTLVIHGDVDLLVPPPNGRILAERIPGAELKIIPGVGHMFFWEEPEETAAMITKFLSRVPARA
ncbi:MAG: alpha/beta hydrolase [Chloroflexota bacterium]|nr:alpha/beta hydrolase [Chloroflexota bacterium]